MQLRLLEKIGLSWYLCKENWQFSHRKVFYIWKFFDYDFDGKNSDCGYRDVIESTSKKINRFSVLDYQNSDAREKINTITLEGIFAFGQLLIKTLMEQTKAVVLRKYEPENQLQFKLDFFWSSGLSVFKCKDKERNDFWSESSSIKKFLFETLLEGIKPVTKYTWAWISRHIITNKFYMVFSDYQDANGRSRKIVFSNVKQILLYNYQIFDWCLFGTI